MIRMHWALYDVTHTPYKITIFSVPTGYMLATCSTGTECEANLALANPCTPTIAYIDGYGYTMPPRIVVASSGVMRNGTVWCPSAR